MMLTRRQALATLAASLPSTAAPAQPNFIVITIDDLGYADVQPFGDVPYTPHLKRMAEEGLTFTSWYAAPVCSPSRSALLTGCYPRRVGLSFGSWHPVLMPGDWHGLNPSEMTVAEVLKARGYRTGCIGKWHLGDQPEFLPTRQGFDSYFGIPYSNDMRPTPKPLGIAQRPHPPLPMVRNETLVHEIKDQDFLTAAYTAEAVSFLKENRRRPFFLYLPHSMVHAPLAAGQTWRGKTGKELYHDSVAEIDWSVGTILQTLRDLNLDKNTLVFFMSDNGGTPRADNKPLRGNKASTWEGGIRVPALAWWPGTVPAGKRSQAITSNMDILPTLAALAGAPLPKVRIDGHNLSGMLRRPTDRHPYDAFFYWSANKLEAVREGDWKLRQGELYNLADDIGETRNVAAQHPDIVKRLTARLEAHRADLGDGDQPGPGVRACGKAKGPLRFWIGRHPESGFPPQAPVKDVPGAPVD
ncbi:MAG: sulfatase [Bryobacterales bacterium]|nr:sulfatase [Bryobacterales bacterium]